MLALASQNLAACMRKVPARRKMPYYALPQQTHYENTPIQIKRKFHL